MAGKKKDSSEAASTSGVKRNRNESAAEVDENNIEVVPYRARTKHAAPVSVAAADAPGELMDQCRICPRVLVEAMKGLNDKQRRAVQALGFDNLFHLQIATVPARILSWCLDKFDPESCNIDVPNHAPLHIAAEDVYLVFGFPRGPLQIETVSRTKDKSLVHEWTTMFNKTQYKVRPLEVVSKMMAEVDGRDWFKRLFIMLVECCLFENAADGYVMPKVMDILRDLSKIREHNWCDHMISYLLRGHERWVDSNHKKFNGPAVFLALFYVDRVVHCKRTVTRGFPLLKGWTTKALRKIEKVGLGRGYVEERFNAAHHTWGSSHPGGQANSVKGNRREEGGPVKGNTDPTEAYTLQLLRMAKTVADSMSTLMTLIIEAPLPIRQDVRFHNVVQTSSLLIGVKGPSQDAPAESSGLSCTQRLAADNMGSLEWQNNVTLMAEVLDEKLLLEEHLEHPSFSLGLTQVLNDAVVGAGSDHAAGGIVDVGFNKGAVDLGNVSIRANPVIPDAAVSTEDGMMPAVTSSLARGKVVDRRLENIGSDQAGVAVLPSTVSPAPEIDTTAMASDAIASVVKDLNVQHFMDMLDANSALLTQKSPSLGVGKGGVPVFEETVSDIVEVINSEPTMIHTQCGVAVGVPQEIGKEKDSDDEPLINKLKRTAKRKFPSNEAEDENHIRNVIARGKGKRPAADAKEPSSAGLAADVCAAGGDQLIGQQARKGKAAVAAKIRPGHGMAKRTAAKMKKSISMLSPFNERAVCVRSKLTSSEKELYQWMATITEDSKIDDVFANDDVVAFRSDIMTLQPHQYLDSGVIDAWASHLNFQERMRSQDSPSRFFFSTFPCSFTFVDTPAKWGSKLVKEQFWTRLDDEVEVVQGFNLGNIDMVFIPICNALHYYVMVMGLRRRQIDLLDNSSAQLDKPLSVKYGAIPTKVAKAFCEWMINNDFLIKGRAMQNLKVQRLQLPWSDEDNDVDSGVYAMRHMETYMGGRVKDWNAGFDANAAKVLQELRVKYTATLLNSEANHNRRVVSNRVLAWLEGLRSVR